MSTKMMSRSSLLGIGIAVVMALIMLGPIITVVIWAFAEQWRYPSLLPTQWGLKFFEQLLARESILGSIWNSVVITFAATTIGALICWPAAYAFARLNFPGRQILLFSFLAAHGFPKFAVIITIAITFLRLDLIGTMTGVILATMISGLLFLIWIPTNAFRAVPHALEEAAFDLGASRLRVFLEVTLPQTLPALAASYIFAFVYILFEVEIGLLIGAPHVTTMPVMLMQLAPQVVVQHAAALCVILWVPCFVLLLLSRRLMRSDRIGQGLGA